MGDPGALEHQRGRLPAVETVIEAGGDEALKTMTEAERVLRELAQAGRAQRRRRARVRRRGGGRSRRLCRRHLPAGVPVVQAPTTLVAQVDSAYGGKTGVDLPEAKNYAGAYHMPHAVLTEPGALTTLPSEELVGRDSPRW